MTPFVAEIMRENGLLPGETLPGFRCDGFSIPENTRNCKQFRKKPQKKSGVQHRSHTAQCVDTGFPPPRRCANRESPGFLRTDPDFPPPRRCANRESPGFLRTNAGFPLRADARTGNRRDFSAPMRVPPPRRPANRESSGFLRADPQLQAISQKTAEKIRRAASQPPGEVRRPPSRRAADLRRRPPDFRTC